MWSINCISARSRSIPIVRARGLGGLLLNCVLRLAQRLECEVIQLEVRESNEPARSLYRSRGFVEEAVRRNLYSKPKEDGVLMGLPTPKRLDHSAWERVRSRWPGGLLLRWDDRGGRLDERWPVVLRCLRYTLRHEPE